MDIATAVQNALNKIVSIYQAVSNKGGTLPAKQDLNNLPTAISSITELKGEAITITPTTSQQTITPSNGKNGITSITVNPVTSAIDSNIQADNIVIGRTILGVNGSGGTWEYSSNVFLSALTPTTSIYNTSDCLCGNARCLGFYETDEDIVFDGIVNIAQCSLTYRFLQMRYIGDVSFPDLYSISGDSSDYYSNAYGYKACEGAFLASAIKALLMPNLYSIHGDKACRDMCRDCSSLASINLSSLDYIVGEEACCQMFWGASGYSTSLDLSSLEQIVGKKACYKMFSYMTKYNNNFNPISGVTSVNLSNLETMQGDECCSYMFDSDKLLSSVDLSSLKTIDGSKCMKGMFRGTAIASLSFNSLNSNSFGVNTDQFDDMLDGVTGCTVHFPSNLQSVIGSWTSVQNGFGGTNTTVLFDLTATT